MKEHVWYAENQPTSSEIHKCSHKNEERFKKDLELERKLAERNQRKDELLQETDTQR